MTNGRRWLDRHPFALHPSFDGLNNILYITRTKIRIKIQTTKYIGDYFHHRCHPEDGLLMSMGKPLWGFALSKLLPIDNVAH
jgi:hypothetical protein